MHCLVSPVETSGPAVAMRSEPGHRIAMRVMTEILFGRVPFTGPDGLRLAWGRIPPPRPGGGSGEGLS